MKATIRIVACRSAMGLCALEIGKKISILIRIFTIIRFEQNISMSQKATAAVLVVVAILSFFYFVHHSRLEATMLFVNGNVYTLDAQNSVAQGVAVHGSRIVAVGSTEELKNHFAADTVVDLHGQTIMPGLIDGHAHMYGLGQLLQSVILVGVKNPEEIVLSVKKRVDETPRGQWIYGRGWDQNLWPSKDFPTAAMLDPISPDHPVVLIRIDGHAIWVNSKAMEIAGISGDTKDTTGGRILRYPDGRPTGVFTDNARDLVENSVPPPSAQEIEQCILRAATECAKLGITEVGDMGIDSIRIAIYKKLADEGGLPIRIYAAIGAPSATWDEWSKRTPLIGYGDGMLTIRAMKMYVDGALGSRGAALVESYSDDLGNRGLTMNESSLEPNLRKAIEQGYQPCVHAIGDRGNHIVLDMYEKVLKSVPKGDYRPRIEHAQVLLPEDISRFSSLGVIPSMQPIHATSDMFWAEARLGPQRIKGAYAWHSLIQAGSLIVGGTDFPNDGMNPLWNFYAAITRSDRTGYPQDGWYRGEKMTREEAACCLTQWAAYGAFEEGEKGTIEPGKLADLTILSKDIMTIPPMDILSTDIVMTIVGGKVVYQKVETNPAQ